MTTLYGLRYPKLRPVDPRPIVHEGQPLLLLRDPLRLSDKMLLVPEPLVPLLALCDGTREDAGALGAAFAIRFGQRVHPDTLDQLLAALDEALLLENERSAQAQEEALSEYRAAPYRELALAGQSYPDDANELRGLLQSYVEAAEVTLPTEAWDGRGLVSPHIDYMRGGHVYARVWLRAAERARAADLVVLLGTDHYGGDGQITLTRQNYATPFGVLPTAGDIVDALAESIGEESAFAAELHHRSEHSIELAAVWLHFIREGRPCELVPILCGSFASFVRGTSDPEQDPAIIGFLETLAAKTAGRSVMIVAAGDLAHVGPAFGGQPVDLGSRSALKESDEELMARICEGDAEGFLAAIKRVEDRNNVCGVSPIYLALKLAGRGVGEQVSYDRCPADENETSLVSVCGVLF